VKLKITSLLAFCLFFFVLNAQQAVPGAACQNCPVKGGGLSVMNGTAGIATSYTMSACGLGYTQVSIDLHQRAVLPNSAAGAVQPATVAVTGVPPCSSVIKAFFYVGVIGNGAPFTPSIIAGGDTHPVPLTLIGTDVSPCWSTTGTFVYKADVTAFVNANGTYTISGIPVFPGATDAEGATLFLVYTDFSQPYTGNIVIADGCQVNVGVNNLANTVSGFNVCGTPSLTSSFMLLGDLQGLAPCLVSFNTPTSTPNFTTNPVNDLVWEFISAPGAPASIAQTTASYGVESTGGDCMFLTLAGMYYRSTCLTCLTAPPLSISTLVSPCPASATVAVTGGIGPYTYAWSGTAQTTSVVSGLSVGNHTVTVSDVTGCSLGSATFTLNPSPLASISVNSPPPVCNGSSVAIIAGPALSYSWSPSTSLSTAGSQSAIASPSTSTNYTLNYTNLSGCLGMTTVPVTINQNPLPVLGSNSPLCQNANLLLTASGGSSYLWSGPNNFTSSQQNPTLQAQPAGAGIYQVIVFAPNGCQAFSFTTVSVQPSPTLVATTNAVCQGEPASLSALGAVSYTWTGPNNFSSPLTPSVVIPAAQSSLAGTYTVTGTAANSCTASVAISLSVSPLPTVTTTGANVCEGQGASLSANGALAYSWSGPAGYSSSLPNAFIPVTNGQSAGVYTVTGFSANSCSTSVTVVLSVLALPSLSVTGVSTVCIGQAASLTASGAQSYVWSGPGGTLSATPSLLIASAVNPTPQTYTVTGTAANSCVSMTTAVLATFPLPSVTVNSGKRKVCAGESTTITASGALNYSWSPQGLPPNSSIIVSPGSNTNFIVQGADINGCVNTASITIFVSTCTSLLEHSGSGVSVMVYPNPAQGRFTIVSDQPMRFKIVNGLGQFILEGDLNSANHFSYCVDEVAEGVYYVVSVGGDCCKKVIVRH